MSNLISNKFCIDKKLSSMTLICILSFYLTACNSDVDKKQIIDDSDFYTLDFENEEITMEDVKRQFFTTFPHPDPTEGNVIYDRVRWKNDDIVSLKPQDGLYLSIKQGADITMFDAPRLTSKASYNLTNDKEQILFVFKGTMPSGNAIWPAWWLNGSYEKEWLTENAVQDKDLDKYSGKGNFYDTSSAVNSTDWPSAGEVDIIENINGQTLIHNTLHTCPQMYDSTWNGSSNVINCANGKPSDPNAGCSGTAYQIDKPEGTFAALWSKNSIEFFYWTLDADVRSKGGPLSLQPNPASWRDEFRKNHVLLKPTDQVCDESIHQPWQCKNCAGSETKKLANLKMIFNITLCGKWAGAQFDNTPSANANCQAYIAGEGAKNIDSQFIKIAYLSVKRL